MSFYPEEVIIIRFSKTGAPKMTVMAFLLDMLDKSFDENLGTNISCMVLIITRGTFRINFTIK